MRSLGYNVIYFIQLIRFFGFRKAIVLFWSVLFSSGNHIILRGIFKNPVLIRKRASDLPIFYQVFCELHYDIGFYLKDAPKTIIDAGANVGYASLYFSEKYPEAKIVAVEPAIQNFEVLTENLSNYDNVKTLQAGVWYKDEKLNIKDPDSATASFEMEASSDEAALQGYTVNSIMEKAGFSNVDLLKMDIEGAEYFLFQHDPHTWLPAVKCLVIELHDNLQPGLSAVFFKEMSRYNWETYVKGENLVCIRR